MANKKQGSAGRVSAVSGVTALFTDEGCRPVAVRYLVPIVSVLLTVLFAALPMIQFRTKGGLSDANSLFYWIFVLFFGVDNEPGAYEFLLNASAGNQSVDFYRAVLVTCILAAVLFAVGFAATVLSSVGAFYLLLTEETTEKSKSVGRIFRVVFGSRWVTLVPYALTVVPFAFPHLVAYYQTTFLSVDTAAAFNPFDPIIVAALLLLSCVFAIAFTKDKERHAKYDIFRSPAARVTASGADADSEWEAAVKADAEGKPIFSWKKTKAEPKSEKQIEASDALLKRAEAPPPAIDEESLYGKEIFLEGGIIRKGEAEQKSKKTKAEPVSRENTDQNEREMRETLEALFASDSETESKNSHLDQKKKRK